MSRKRSTAREDWQRLADYLKAARDALGHACVAAGQVLPVRQADRIGAAQDRVDKLRSDFENEMFRRGGPEDTRVFYPGPRPSNDGRAEQEE